MTGLAWFATLFAGLLFGYLVGFFVGRSMPNRSRPQHCDSSKEKS